MISLRFLARQLSIAVLTIICVSTLVFVAMRAAPGDPARTLLGEYGSFVPEEHVRVIREALGLDKPMWQQYLLFWKSIATGQFGISFRTGETVRSMVANRFPMTLELALSGLVMAVLLGLSAGVLAASYCNTWIDRTAMIFSTFGLVAPSFWTGLVLLYFFAFVLGWFPMIGTNVGSSPLAVARALVLPGVTIGYPTAALLARITRSSMLEVIAAQYVTTARAKGLPERIVILKHAFRNAMLPIVTLLGVNTAYLLGGAVVVEVVFSRPGIGRMLVDGIFTRDYPVVQGTVLLFAILVVAANLLTDTLYGLLDPRVRAR